MRRRITYIRDARNDDGFTPDDIQVSTNSLTVRQLFAAKEHRLTIDISELPATIASVLHQCHKLHIRWSSPRLLPLSPPFSSRVPPGLHVFLTPQKNKTIDSICPMLRDIFSGGITCNSHTEAFTTPEILSERLSAITGSQFYSYVPSLADFVLYVQQQICSPSAVECQEAAFSLLSASSFDVDFDETSLSVVIAAFWNQGRDHGGMWNEKNSKLRSDDRVEIGILNGEKTGEEAELSVGGWLTVIEDDKKPKPTLFSFPTRHRSLPSNTTHPSPTFKVSFDTPTGLHPTLRINFHNPERLTRPMPTCALHAYVTLPSTLFLDRHAFSDPVFLSSHNLAALRSISGATDLEAPDWAIRQWGSAILLELSSLQPHVATIPLHARFGVPAAGGLRTIAMPWPVVFWACPAEEGAEFGVNPFDRLALGYDELFRDPTVFYHVLPRPSSGDEGGSAEELISKMALPVLDVDRSGYVEVGTVVVVVLGFAWICWALFGPVAPTRAGPTTAGGDSGRAIRGGNGKAKRKR